MGLTIAGCGGDKFEKPADVAGDYMMSLTNGENTCQLQNWTQGDTLTGVPVTITQEGSTISADVQGIPGGVLNIWFGNQDAFVGNISGSEMTLTRWGSIATTVGTCAITLKGTIQASISGDTVTGTVTYEPATTPSPDCAQFAGCHAIQDFNGTRPPQ